MGIKCPLYAEGMGSRAQWERGHAQQGTDVGMGVVCKIRKAQWPVCNKIDDLAS